MIAFFFGRTYFSREMNGNDFKLKMTNFNLYNLIIKNSVHILLFILITISCQEKEDELEVESWELSDEVLGVGFDDIDNTLTIKNTGSVKLVFEIHDDQGIFLFDREFGEISANGSVEISYSASDKAMNKIEEFDVNLVLNDSAIVIPAYASAAKGIEKVELTGKVVHALSGESNKIYIAYKDRVDVYRSLNIIESYNLNPLTTAIAVDENQDILVVGNGLSHNLQLSVYSLSTKVLLEQYDIPWSGDSDHNVTILDIEIIGDDFIYLTSQGPPTHGIYVDRKESTVNEDKGYLVYNELLFKDPLNDGWIFSGEYVTFINYQYRQIQAYTSWNTYFGSGTVISDEGRIFLSSGSVFNSASGVSSIYDYGTIKFPFYAINGRPTSLSADCNIDHDNVLYFRGQNFLLFPYHIDIFNYTSLDHKFSLAVNGYKDYNFYLQKNVGFIFHDKISNKGYLILEKEHNKWFLNAFSL